MHTLNKRTNREQKNKQGTNRERGTKGEQKNKQGTNRERGTKGEQKVNNSVTYMQHLIDGMVWAENKRGTKGEH